MAAVDEALDGAGARAGDVERFVHGMTVGTNALLEGRVARTALLATEGFTDLEELGRQARAELYRLCAGHPPPLVPAELRVPVPERTGPDGVLRELDEDALRAALDGLDVRGGRGLPAVGLPPSRSTSGAWPSCSRRRVPGVHVSTSHETAGVFREYERCATTVVDAALSPLLRGYLERLTERARDAGLPEPEVMLSSGGTAERRRRRRATRSWTVLSGPGRRRGGRGPDGRAAGARRRRPRHGRHVVRRVADRRRRAPRWAAGARSAAARWRCRWWTCTRSAPAAARSPGATRAARCAWARARRGPIPGPACYGRGGEEPTVTDANLLLGYLDAELAARRRRAARPRRRPSARSARWPTSSASALEETAAGIVRVASAEMAQAVRVVTVERGIDPRDLALVAVRRRRARCTPRRSRTSWACAAWWCRVASRRAVGARAGRRPSAAATWWRACCSAGDDADDARRSPRRWSGWPSAAASELGARGRRAARHLRPALRGPGVRAAGRRRPASPIRPICASAFDRAHEERYGYSDPDAELELVTVRVAVALPGAEPRRPGRRWDARLPRRALRRRAAEPRCVGAGRRARRPGDLRAARLDAGGAAGLARTRRGRRGGDGAMSAPRPGHAPGDARQPARRLRRDGRGAGALGPLGEHQGAPRRLHRACSTRAARWSCRPSTSRCTWARCRRRWRPCSARSSDPGDAWILNDPYRGGTHLPDITVITPLFHDGRAGRASPPAARTTPTSAPRSPAACRRDSRTLDDEGVVIPPTRLDRRGAPRAGRPDAQPAPARGRPARPAGRRTRGRRAGGRADRALRPRHLPRRPRGDARLRRAPHARPHRRARRTACARRSDVLEAAEGDLELRARAHASTGDELELDFTGSADAARRQPQLPARGDAVRLLLRAARAHRPRRAALRGRLPPAHRDRARGLACSTRARRPRWRPGNVETSSRVADLVLGRLRPRARPGHDEQPHARQRRLHLLRDARRRPGRLPGRRRPERRARGDVEHAQHADRGARARVPAAGASSTRCGAARAAPAATAAATGWSASWRRSTRCATR